MGLPHRVILCATLAVAQNMGQWVGGEHCAGSHCGPGKDEKEAKRCEHPAGAGAHVLYNASVAVGDKTEHLTTRWVHAVVDGRILNPLTGACAGETVEVDEFPEEFRHRASEKGAKVLAEVVHVTSADDVRLIDALKAREFDVAAKLVNEDHVGVNARDDHGVPALSIAVQLRQPVLAASLLNAVDPRVDVDAATPSGYTALHFAVGSNDRNVVKALLRRGADPNAQITQEQSGGWGPLHFACRLGHLEIAKSLLDFDADPLLTGNAGENAFKVAEDAAVPYATRKKIAGLLNEAMARRGGEL
ncbi:unnamed protein product [Pelagomonas calceolata]|uniref:RING-type E3 ubiquitin transferase n=1 Tax=Pelagomonas calceolata TaxID=35677 RepID=A0A8J2X0B6_9STRA|nr:unnamed protein product [Pelagomonas calceolata]|mmetsp:Transcript_8737/g.24936  ORF Transcript_8737/g.24936 Transcript_8737/m.24936 type:complete len:303 (+) Transcript_8737:74-982(+)